MSKLRRIVLLRHGDTVGNSKERFHGSSDIALSDEGRAQVLAASRELAREVFEIVVASPLRRSWESAQIVAGGAPVRLEAGFREVHFGRWEGMTAAEIEASDPVLYKDWQAKAPGFEYPSGELRAEFKARVLASLESLQESGVNHALVVVHKGVIRTIAEHLLGAPIEAGIPALGESVSITRGSDGSWFVGRRGSNPEGLEAA